MTSAVDFMMSHDYPEWHEQARCADKPQEWFFGGEEQPGKARHRPSLSMSEVRRAKAVCFLCPVQMECLDYALTHHEEFGVWGGSTSRDRARYWREHGEEAQSA
jgi:WhiB family redox-sensing transcriptional regulator